MARQRGVTLSGLLLICVVLGSAAILAAKIVPDVIEYYSIVKNVKAVAEDPAMRGASLGDIKTSFSKRAEIDNIKAITAQDLDISKDGDQVVIDFAYERKIPLFANASLVLDFEHSTSK